MDGYIMLIYDAYFEEIINKINSLIDMIAMNNFWGNAETISNIIVNIVVTLGGILGLLYYRKLKEKQMNAAFSYLTQFQVRLKTLQTLFIEYENQIMERFIPETKRREDADAISSFINEIINEFSRNALETLKFLQESQEQMPASKDWINKYEILIEFLLDAEHLSMPTFYKWIDDDENQLRDRYVKKHKKNLAELLNDIKKEQQKNIKKIFQSKFQTVTEFFKKR